MNRLEPELCAFQLDNDYGWDDGLICGGRMLVLVDPIASADDADYFTCLHNALERGDACVEAIAFDAAKSGLPAPSSYLINSAGSVLASRHAETSTGVLPSIIRQVLADLPSSLHAQVSSGVSYLPQRGRCPLLIVGGGHVGQAVAMMATELDFDVWVLDDRAEFVDRARFPRATRLIHGEIGATLEKLDITPDTYALIVTRGHNHDEEALYHLVNRGARYVGMIGSRRKIRLIFDDLEAQGVSPDLLSKVYAPVGIEIGSQTVPEIAISILAELVAHRNCRGNVPGRPAAIHACDT